MNHLSYRHTLWASYLGYITQAIVNNLAPLLFLTFQRQFGVSLSSLALLITVNFGIQLLVDLAASRFVDKIGYRRAALAAHLLCTLGLLLMGTLPFILPDPYTGIVAAVIVNALGGGLIEVIISPIVEALPGERKAASMSLLHSFYCWGYVLVVILSTAYFNLFGIERWRCLPLIWAILPLGNFFLFARVPMKTLIDPSAAPLPLGSLLTRKVFLLLFLMMICSGASEQAMSQWASLFAEAGLGVSKTTGDLLGPCAFAVLMGLSRVFFGLRRGHIKLELFLLISGGLSVISYLITVFSPFPLLSLAGCALCGLSAGVMWPGTFSLSSRIFPLGGTAMFAILALAGDMGCAAGPALVGLVMNRTTLTAGLFTAILFPALLVLGAGLLRRRSSPAVTDPPDSSG
jgi:fucose permease